LIPANSHVSTVFIASTADRHNATDPPAASIAACSGLILPVAVFN